MQLVQLRHVWRVEIGMRDNESTGSLPLSIILYSLMNKQDNLIPLSNQSFCNTYERKHTSLLNDNRKQISGDHFQGEAHVSSH